MNSLPAPLGALFQLLRDPASDPRLSDSEWQAVLSFADRTQLTLHLSGSPALPDWLQTEIQVRRAKNLERRARLWNDYLEIAAAFTRDRIDFVLLKGFTHETGFGLEGSQRIQYDIDLLCLPADAPRALRALEGLGYKPHGAPALSDQHPPPMVRPFDVEWRGDYFDPRLPISIDVHTSPWSASLDCIDIEEAAHFWFRRTVAQIGGHPIPALHEADRLAFAAMHALRHILRNDARPAHVYELARFLNCRSTDEHFWSAWDQLYDAPLKRIQAVALRFASEWFNAPLPTAVLRTSLPAAVHAWFRDFSFSPAANLCHPNKDIVWLHMALLSNWRDRLSVLRRRLAPLRIPERAEVVSLEPDSERRSVYPARLARRAAGHASALGSALVSGARWLRQLASSALHTSD